MDNQIFPAWTNSLRYLIPVAGVVVPTYLILLIYYGGHPDTTHVNYSPTQPIAYSHAMHAGQLGMDCRYCHNTVDQAGHAAVPPTATCVGCHQNIRPNSPLLTKVWESWETDKPIEWTRVHRLPDYVYFNHSVHVARGVGCSTCHGRVDKMEVVYTAANLSMGWCLDCHREPEKFVRPLDRITDMAYHDVTSEEEQLRIGQELVDTLDIHPAVNCSTCHR